MLEIMLIVKVEIIYIFLGSLIGVKMGTKAKIFKPLGDLFINGMFTIVVIIDSKTKKIIGTPQITSRGFIFVKENFDLVNATKRVVEKVVKEKTSEGLPVNWDYVKNNIRESVGSFLFTKTERRPMVLPVVIEV